MRELQADRGTPLTRPPADPPAAAPEEGAAAPDPAVAPDPAAAPTPNADAEHPSAPDTATANNKTTAADDATATATPDATATTSPDATMTASPDATAMAAADATATAGDDAPATAGDDAPATAGDDAPVAEARTADSDPASANAPSPDHGPAAPEPTPADPAATQPDPAETGPASTPEKTPRAARVGRWLFALVALVTLALDLVSKLLVVAELENPNHPPVQVLDNVLYLVHTRNTGAAFSLGSSYTWILTAIAVGVILVIIRTARKLASTGWAVALGLILGGACGNVVDRLFRENGGVVDFLALVDPFDPPWPVFNLADSALCVGVVILVGMELAGRRLDGTRAKDRAQSKDD